MKDAEAKKEKKIREGSRGNWKRVSDHLAKGQSITIAPRQRIGKRSRETLEKEGEVAKILRSMTV